MGTTGWMYQENCNCPMSAEKWLAALQCPLTYPQLDEGLSQFGDTSLDMRLIEKQVHQRWPKRQGSGALMHYVIKNGRVLRSTTSEILLCVNIIGVTTVVLMS